MPKCFYVARSPKGGIITYGFGSNTKAAERMCRDEVSKHYPSREVAAFEPFKLSKPKFKKGQKVREPGSSLTYKVLANGDTPWIAGCILIDQSGWFHSWVSETRFNAA